LYKYTVKGVTKYNLRGKTGILAYPKVVHKPKLPTMQVDSRGGRDTCDSYYIA